MVGWGVAPFLHISPRMLFPRLRMRMAGGMTFPSTSRPVTFNHLCRLDAWGGNAENLPFCPVLSSPQGKYPLSQPISNPRDTHCSSVSRQLIQELRLKEEKKSLQTKEKTAEMQGESSGEPARGKSGRNWPQKQQQKCKAATTHASKQVNVEGRGAHMPGTLPRLGPIRGGLLRRPLLRAQTH